MKKEPRTIVSMTSFPAALPFAAQALGSIFRQSTRPDLVVLYLTKSQFPDGIPKILQEITDPIFQVRFYDENIRSFTKLIPALIDFPSDIIITADDDVDYPKNMIAHLLRAHRRQPNVIFGNRVRRVRFDDAGNLLPYRQWKIYKRHRYLFMSMRPRFTNMLTGVGGVLYPPRAFGADVFDQKTFMDLAPSVDDVWFWLMSVKNGTKTAPLRFARWKEREIKKPDAINLKTTNRRSGIDVNLNAANAILKKYPKINSMLKKECIDEE